LNVINQFLETPLDLGGKKAKELLSKKTRRRRRARRSPTPSDSDADNDDEPVRKKREKKKKEKETYKSAQFIEDSDEEYGDMEMFLEREKLLRERTAKAAAEGNGIGTMKPTGTKKRRRTKDDRTETEKKKLKPDSDSDSDDMQPPIRRDVDAPYPVPVASPKRRPRPRPKPRARVKNLSNTFSPLKDSDATVARIPPGVNTVLSKQKPTRDHTKLIPDQLPESLSFSIDLTPLEDLKDPISAHSPVLDFYRLEDLVDPFPAMIQNRNLYTLLSNLLGSFCLQYQRPRLHHRH
jgi:replication fork protection complex subunit Tof1/Swi1